MNEQLPLTLAASTIGVLSTIFFAIGNALNSTETIIQQSGSYWDFSESLARSLAAQRAQYATGALLLLAAFALQVLAALASTTTPANLPQWFGTWQYFVVAVLLPVGLLSWFGCGALEESTMLIRLAPKDTTGGSQTSSSALPVVAAPSFWELNG